MIMPPVSPARSTARLISPEGVAGFAAVASMYMGEAGILRVGLQLIVLLALAASLLRDLAKPFGYAGAGLGRATAQALLAMALGGFLLSFLLSLGSRQLSVQDVGVFVLQAVVPAMILLARGRKDLVVAAGRAAVLFALIDAAANFLGAAGLVDIRVPVRSIAGETQFAFAGLSGSTLGAGFVAFAACCHLGNRARMPGAGRWAAIGLILLLLVSMQLIQSRRYLGLALVALTLFAAWGPIRRIGLHWVSLGVAGLFLWLTFSAIDDPGNALRGLLMLNGLERAIASPVIGAGPTYFVYDDVTATFTELAEIGVTESQLIDFAVAYGLGFALLYLCSILLALAVQKQPKPFLPAVILTTMTAELFFGGPLAAFPATLLFYGSLAACLEPAGAQRAGRPRIAAA